MEKTQIYFIYFLANWNNKVMYIGVTSHLQRRINEHRNKIIKDFTEKYNTHKLVYFEETRSIKAALKREKQLKKWRRKKKDDLVTSINPQWKDLYIDLFDSV